MARYKMTVVFDVHDDEDRGKLRRLKARQQQRPFFRRLYNPTNEDERIKELEHNPLIDRFLAELIKRLGIQDSKVRTTYEIISCDKLPELTGD
jgi:hypothetical protein